MFFNTESKNHAFLQEFVLGYSLRLRHNILSDWNSMVDFLRTGKFTLISYLRTISIVFYQYFTFLLTINKEIIKYYWFGLKVKNIGFQDNYTYEAKLFITKNWKINIVKWDTNFILWISGTPFFFELFDFRSKNDKTWMNLICSWKTFKLGAKQYW